jgi:hypothetical protein
MTLLHSWIAGLGLLRRSCAPEDIGAGVLVRPVPYSPVLDDIGERNDVRCWRLRGEDDRCFGHRLALHLQEQILVRENFERLLDQVLAVRR